MLLGNGSISNLSESVPSVWMLPDKGTCRDDGFNYGAAAMNLRNATDFDVLQVAR